MPFIDEKAGEINFKLVYQGPGLSGKTTNLQFIYRKTRPEAKGKMISLRTETERRLFFDFRPLLLGKIRGYTGRFHLYTVPSPSLGSADYDFDLSLNLVLKDVDGIVFVANSQHACFDANVAALGDLDLRLATQGRDLARLPMVLQYNKRDLPNTVPLAELDAALNPGGRERFEAVAPVGTGVFDTLKAIARQVLAEARQAL